MWKKMNAKIFSYYCFFVWLKNVITMEAQMLCKKLNNKTDL